MRITRLIIFFISTMILYWIAMAGLFISFAYSKGWIFADFEFINAKQAIVRLADDSNITLLDVRTVKEYEEKHLKNAINIPVQQLDSSLIRLEKVRSKPIMVYCRSGSRSIKASRILEKNGFTPLNVEGGIIELIRNDAEIVR
ncbi:rhodanese-like domain-containing protein [Sulfurovum sp. XTW-4]|uniref:Rhodanese-like domain-containing protein n=1 Tax=Sulfurovum xiamenensis TaxID=3019066 RepID=A0ABT7QR81_9BACT|nr:rhodanese-like domain-containing protein [Sulfurovum xiamenensis]MDM5263525.1 rhodanese-like domain-containing protein [Sulfurovum xiamenensis]